MSDPKTKAERSKAKDVRQGIVEQRPVSSNKKKKLKYKIICELHLFRAITPDFCYGKYATLTDAENALKTIDKKFRYYVNPRIEEV